MSLSSTPVHSSSIDLSNEFCLISYSCVVATAVAGQSPGGDRVGACINILIHLRLALTSVSPWIQ